MELDHEFTVPAPVDTVWQALLDIERMAPLMPGVTHESGVDGEYQGKVKLKFGPLSVTYKGTVHMAVVDELTRTAILEAHAKEARGKGTAAATFQATVLPTETGARVTLHTKVDLTGRSGELSDHLVHESGNKILTKFAANLGAALTAPEPVPAEEPEIPELIAEPETPDLTAEPEPSAVAESEPVAEPGQRAEEPVPEDEPVEVAESVAAVKADAEKPAAEPFAEVREPVPPSAFEDEFELYEFLPERSPLKRMVLAAAGISVLLLLIWRIVRRRR